MMVIGITGRRGSGKDTVAQYLEEKHGFAQIDFTRDILAPILQEREIEVTRMNLINLAMSEREKTNNGIWAGKIGELIKKRKLEKAVVSGIRFSEEVDVFRKLFAKRFILIAIECDDRKRYERVVKRGTKGEGKMGYAEFLRIEEKPTEKAILRTVGLADVTLDNNGTVDELKAKLEESLKMIYQAPW